MIEVQIKYLPPFNSITNKNSEIIKIKKGSMVEDIINILVKKYNRQFSKNIYNYDNNNNIIGYKAMFILNGNIVDPDIIIDKDSKLVILMTLSGG